MNDKPWLDHYDEGVPHTLAPYPPITLPDVLRQASKEVPDLPALLFLGSQMSYTELERQSDAFAAALHADGVRKGDRVAVLLPNSPQMIVAEFGIWKTGAIGVLLNPLWTEHEIERAIDECEASVAVVLAPFYDKINALRSRTPLTRVVITGIQDYLAAAPPGHSASNLHHGDVEMLAMIASHRESALPVADLSPKDPALFLFSGGTTGKPKCAIGRHEALIMTGMQVDAWFTPVLGVERVPFMLNLPLHHVYPQAAMMSCAFLRRSPMVLVPDPRNFELLISTIKHLEVGVLPGVPTLFNALAAHPMLREDPHTLDSLKLIISAAAPLHLETRSRFEELTGATIIEAYGLTEAMVSPVGTPVIGTSKPGAVGLPVPDIEVRIVDADTGIETLPPGEVGEVVIRSPQIMTGFWKEPEETAAVLRDGWIYTGDLGYLDDDGFLYIVDRKKDVIKPSGFQVWPREVEEAISTHPAVLECGVAGVPDDYQVEAVKAWVVLRKESTLDAEQLKNWCRQELAAYKIPKHIEFCAQLPKSGVGKVLRRVLVEQHNAG
ncbi:MAG: long-chain fatty acid--CoA ligase [Chlorobaculum sp.]|nr:long-chain fatty acid--CoA ligase [Chlorobaculum sp.]